MTRKTRNKRDSTTTVDGCNIKTTTVNNDNIIKRTSEKCGYCEKCRVEYESLTLHLQSNEHMNFVKNSDNYLALDSLINNGTNVESFLKMNRSPHRNTATSPTSTKPSSPIDVFVAAESNGQAATVTPTNHHANHNHNVRSRKNSIRRSSDGSLRMDVDEEAVPISLFKHMNGNGTAGDFEHDEDPLAPKPINNCRDKLPKYSPPTTRRSQNKTNKSPVKSQSSPTKSTFERFNFLVDTKDNKAHVVTDSTIAAAAASAVLTTNDTNPSKRNETIARVDDDSPQARRIFRAFPRYKVIDGTRILTKNNVASAMSPTETTTTTTMSTTTNELKNALSHGTKSEPMFERTRDPETGIIVKFKRVRESELSKLTYEADNFMFPKQRDEQPTDEDRQTTSERGPADVVTSDIVSSEVDERQSVSPVRKPANVLPDEPEQFTSSGRRKKRRTQYDSFIATQSTKRKSSLQQQPPPQSPQKEQQSAQEDVTETNLNTTSTSSNTRRQTTRRRKGAAAKAATESTNGEPANSESGGNSNSGFDTDGKYNGGSILSTDFFKTMKFSFERVPTNEPWYLTFQRQDECHERVFEYWGNTGMLCVPSSQSSSSFSFYERN